MDYNTGCRSLRIHCAQYREASRSRNRWVPWGLTTATITKPQNRQLSRLFQILGRTGNYRNYFRSLPLNGEFLHRSTMSWQQIVAAVNRYLWWWLVRSNCNDWMGEKIQNIVECCLNAVFYISLQASAAMTGWLEMSSYGWQFHPLLWLTRGWQGCDQEIGGKTVTTEQFMRDLSLSLLCTSPCCTLLERTTVR